MCPSRELKIGVQTSSLRCYYVHEGNLPAWISKIHIRTIFHTYACLFKSNFYIKPLYHQDVIAVNIDDHHVYLNVPVSRWYIKNTKSYSMNYRVFWILIANIKTNTNDERSFSFPFTSVWQLSDDIQLTKT